MNRITNSDWKFAESSRGRVSDFFPSRHVHLVVWGETWQKFFTSEKLFCLPREQQVVAVIHQKQLE